MEIKFNYSENGIPVITIGEFGSLIFSNLTSHPTKGYRYICYSHSYDDMIGIKNTTGRRKTVAVPTSESFVVNMYLERKKKTSTSKAIGLPHRALPGRMKDYLKKVMLPLIDDEGYMSYDNIEKLKRKLHGKDIQKILSKIQKKRMKRGKKIN